MKNNQSISGILQPTYLDGLESWRKNIAGADGIIIQDFRQIVGFPFSSFREELAAIQAQNTSVVFLTAPGRFERATDLRDHLPFHPSHDLPTHSWERYQRQLRRSNDQLESFDMPIVTTGQLSQKLIGGAVFSPLPVKLSPPQFLDQRPEKLRFLVGPGYRGTLEKAAISELVELLGRAGHLVEYSASVFSGSTELAQYHFVIDTLGLGDYSEFAARAMGQSCILIGSSSPPTGTGTGLMRPGLVTDPKHVIRDVIEYVHTCPSIHQAQLDSFEYATLVHNGRLTQDTLFPLLQIF